VIAAAVIGAGPLVRPELGAMVVCFAVAWFVLVRPHGVLPDVTAMFALPLAYELFRMGYYASLVPNTALAKDAGGLHFSQGWEYARDFVTPYRLWVPAAIIVAAIVIQRRDRPDRRLAIATFAMLAAGVVAALYIILVGGDYMHGRLLLPAFFALGLPAAVAVRPRATASIGLCALAACWALLSIVWFRPPPLASGQGLGPAPIADWRAASGARIVPIDVALGLNGYEAADAQARGVRGYFRVTDKEPRPSRDPDAFVITLGSIGVPAYHAGRHVWVIDIGGLAEPLAARADPVPGRQAGHRKQVDEAWYDARFGIDAGTAAARALECGPVEGLIDATNEPLTPGRFFSNMWRSFSFTRLRIPADPVEAEAQFC
jgi:arabinofuranosyltransferase